MTLLETERAARFGLSETECALSAAAAAVANDFDRPPEALGRAELRAIFHRLRPTGYLGSTIPSEAGGAGLSALAFGALVEGLAPNLALLGNHSVQRYIYAFGDEEQRARFLPGLFAGEKLGAIAITEPDAGTDIAAMRTHARRTAGGYLLNGVKTWVMHAAHADVLVVLAHDRDAGGDSSHGAAAGHTPPRERGEAERASRYLVEAGSPGLSFEAIEPVGLGQYTYATVTFSDCVVPERNRLGVPGEGVASAKAAFPLARVLVALQALRFADAALEIAREFANDRRLFGKSLAGRDLVRAEFAAARSRTDAARLFAYRALTTLDRASSRSVRDPGLGAAPDGGLADASAAKALACETALEVGAWVAQLLASMALRREHRINRLLADLRMLATVDGTSTVNRLAAGRRLLVSPE